MKGPRLAGRREAAHLLTSVRIHAGRTQNSCLESTFWPFLVDCSREPRDVGAVVACRHSGSWYGVLLKVSEYGKHSP
jgi:hypothetical protein